MINWLFVLLENNFVLAAFRAGVAKVVNIKPLGQYDIKNVNSASGVNGKKYLKIIYYDKRLGSKSVRRISTLMLHHRYWIYGENTENWYLHPRLIIAPPFSIEIETIKYISKDKINELSVDFEAKIHFKNFSLSYFWTNITKHENARSYLKWYSYFCLYFQGCVWLNLDSDMLTPS